MKKTNAKYPTLLAVGILVMNIGVIINYFVSINDDIVDFFKGLGISFVFASLWLLAKNKDLFGAGC
ncbi:MAG: hypothetical protein H6557_26085 [Lewinellaceae bacterium]|nr:hypothetical protein [Phaeodactylibacter sp.]MCB9040107.1 hypothetical protein [Lewinellaceae bacterium]